MQQFLYLGIPSRVLSFMTMTFLFLSINISTLTAQKSIQPSMVEFEQSIGEEIKGEGYLKFNELEANVSQVEYFFEKKVLPNPYKISYTYNVYKNEDRSLEIDLSSAVEPFEMRIDESVEIKFNGDNIKFPGTIALGQSLDDANGTFNLYTSKGKLFLIYDVSIQNRKVESKEMISVGTQSIEAYVISHDYTMTKTNQFDVVLQNSKQKVTEWVIPGVGVIKQDREGETIKKHQTADESSSSVYFIKNTSKIKDIDRN